MIKTRVDNLKGVNFKHRPYGDPPLKNLNFENWVSAC